MLVTGKLHFFALLTAIFSPSLALESNRLTASNSPDIAVLGSPVDLRCDAPASKTVDSCFWTQPNLLTFEVFPNGTTSPDVAGVTGDAASFPAGCHITVAAASSDDLGGWTCQVTLANVAEFQTAVLNVITESRIDDVRIPVDLRPEEYRVRLIPYIFTNNFTFDGFVAVNLTVDSATDKIYLHSKEQTLWEDTLTVQRNGNNVNVNGFG